MRGRKSVPAVIHNLRGTFRTDRHGPRRSAPAQPADGVGDPPDYLGVLEAECWRELVRISVPGVLAISDRPLVEVTARLWAEQRRPGAGDMSHARLGRFISCLASMGLTPVDRQRVVAVDPAPVASGWDRLNVVGD